MTEYEEDPWMAMSQALIDCVGTHPIRTRDDDPELKPNEFYACGFHVNSKGKFNIDLRPTLGVLCSGKWNGVEDALKEHPSIPKYYFRIYNKDKTAFLAKKYKAFSLYTFKNKRACYEKYNQLIQTELDHYRDIVARLAVKPIPESLISLHCN